MNRRYPAGQADVGPGFAVDNSMAPPTPPPTFQPTYQAPIQPTYQALIQPTYQAPTYPAPMYQAPIQVNTIPWGWLIVGGIAGFFIGRMK